MIAGVVALFGLVLCLVALRNPALGLGLAAAADLVLMEGVPVGGTTVAVESFFFLYLVSIPFLVQLVRGGRAGTPGLPLDEARPFLLFLGAFFLVCLVSAVQGGMAGNSATILSRLPLWGLFGLAPVWLCRGERDLVRVATCVVAACLLLLVMAVLAGLPRPDEQGGLMRHSYLNPLGHGLSLGLVLVVGLWGARERGRRGRLLLPALAACLLVGLLWTGSRGALISAVVGATTVAWVVSPGRTKSFGKLAVLAGSVMFLFALGSGHVSAAWGEFVTHDASSNLYRYQIAVLAVRLFTANPLLGVGLGGMEGAGIFQSSDLGSLAVTIISSDNDYARVLAELGSVGVLVVLAWTRFLGGSLRGVLRERRSLGLRPGPALALGAGIGANLMVLGLFESVLFSPTGWFYVGLAWACARVGR